MYYRQIPMNDHKSSMEELSSARTIRRAYSAANITTVYSILPSSKLSPSTVPRLCKSAQKGTLHTR